MKIQLLPTGVVLLLSLASCQPEYEPGSFGYDLELLSAHADPLLLSSGEGMIAVAGAYQGRVMSSSFEGMEGMSLGWFDREGVLDPGRLESFSSIGGESRLWYGPEAGKFSLFFEPGADQISANVKHPEAIRKAPFKVVGKAPHSVSFEGELSLVNHANTTFQIGIKRSISIMDRKEIEGFLDIELEEELKVVAFEARSTMTNKGDRDWNRETGLLSLWELGCFPPSATIVIPVRNEPDSAMVYFSEIDERRLRIKDGVLYYNGDADYLNKIGIQPQYTLPVFGSWNAEQKVLTIVKFSFGDAPLYVNSHWVYQDDPYGGDVINVFNDGKFAGGGPFGPFYELETSSAAGELKVGESMSHSHATFHFTGERGKVSQLSNKILGVALENIEMAFTDPDSE